jgi:ABC-type multidrug transport system fused ATPase/permease subunit
MDELFAKDATFFHDNFAGSLTKRVLSFASRFEQFVDTLTFSVLGNFVPLTPTLVAIFSITLRTFLLVFHVGDTTQLGNRAAGECQILTAHGPWSWGFAPMATLRKYRNDGWNYGK